MTKFIKLGAANDPSEVKKLQTFLRDYEGFSGLAVTGFYDQATYNAVKKFQAKYASDVLTQWGLSSPTGYVYTSTIKEINEIYCKGNLQSI
jgi:peptidoglycan hydrolase-like protein with peptidoglycan-binding domain